MKIKLNFTISEIQYNSPIIVQKKTLSSNTILTVNIIHNNNLINSIDFSSLSGLHNYTVFEWKFWLDQFFLDKELFVDNLIFDKYFFNMIKIDHLDSFPGELLFIGESILFNILLHLDLIPNFGKYQSKAILLNALYNQKLDSEPIPACLKIKIRPSQSNLKDCIHCISHFLKLNPNMLFRLDGNRSFEFLELDDYLNKLEKHCGKNILNSIEYLEEPFKNFHDIYKLSKNSKYKLAIDESLHFYLSDPSVLQNINKLKFVIIKPSLIGLSQSFALMTKFRENAIVSSTYESASAMNALIFLASLNPSAYHGLDTLKFLPNNLSTLRENYSLIF